MEKQEKIIEMFNQIAPTYDRANRVLSFGIDIKWRKIGSELALKAIQKNEVSIADIACGTGDMMKIWEQMAAKNGVKISNLIGIDPSQEMLKVAKEKLPKFKFIQAYADKTGLESESADIISISYGIRNVVNLKEALSEFYRVLRPGGLVVVLEFTKRKNAGIISKFRDFYLGKILPKIGGFISKNQAAYEYLPSSIDNFLDADAFSKALKNAGFELKIYKNFSFEISSLFIAQKPNSQNFNDAKNQIYAEPSAKNTAQNPAQSPAK